MGRVLDLSWGFAGGRCWVRTNVGLADGFTDRSLWPLGQPAWRRLAWRQSEGWRNLRPGSARGAPFRTVNAALNTEADAEALASIHLRPGRSRPTASAGQPGRGHAGGHHDGVR